MATAVLSEKRCCTQIAVFNLREIQTVNNIHTADAGLAKAAAPLVLLPTRSCKQYLAVDNRVQSSH